EAACSAFQPPSHYSPDAFQPVQLCFNQGLAASSPSSAELSSPLPYSCSPPELSPVSPLTPSPPWALDTKPPSCPMEEWPCHPPCPFASPACGSQHPERLPQCFPCPSTDCTELLPALPVPEDFFRRDRGCDICYS
ncbi:COLC2 protein, partial [Climacteris rufus]|nr:COLC2 protein [Climacteris rufus]